MLQTLPREVDRKEKSFRAKADEFGEIVERFKLLGVASEKRRWRPGPWKALCAVLGNLLASAADRGSCRLWSRSGTSDCGYKVTRAQVRMIGAGL